MCPTTKSQIVQKENISSNRVERIFSKYIGKFIIYSYNIMGFLLEGEKEIK